MNTLFRVLGDAHGCKVSARGDLFDSFSHFFCCCGAESVGPELGEYSQDSVTRFRDETATQNPRDIEKLWDVYLVELDFVNCF